MGRAKLAPCEKKQKKPKKDAEIEKADSKAQAQIEKKDVVDSADVAGLQLQAAPAFDLETLQVCKLCLEDIPENNIFTLKVCKCSFCRTCMVEYVRIMVEEGIVQAITCPDANCRRVGELTRREVEQLSNKSIYTRYIRLNYEREVDLDPSRTFCPEVGCESVCHVCPSGSSRHLSRLSSSKSRAASAPVAKSVHCGACGLRFCSQCKSQWHPDKSCDEVLVADQGIPFTAHTNAAIKRCPVCRIPIERNNGCAQMMCNRCRVIFCWYCLTRLDDDFFLRHYDSGPCKNKLGHSRASVMMHRAQVVGVFAGFSLLLLVASPFLLIAAPCILCCKCKDLARCCMGTDGGSVNGAEVSGSEPTSRDAPNDLAVAMDILQKDSDKVEKETRKKHLPKTTEVELPGFTEGEQKSQNTKRTSV